jgi:hypothetical protein
MEELPRHIARGAASSVPAHTNGFLFGTPLATQTAIMKQFVGIAFLVVGIILLCLAYNSYHSAASGVSRVVTGTSTDKTLWLVVGGVLGTLIGVGGLLAGSKRT